MSFKEILDEIGTVPLTLNYPMKRCTSLGVGGEAKFYAQADSLYSMNVLIKTAKRFKVKYKIIGNGTNLLVSDKGYDGLIINAKKLNDVFLVRGGVRAMAGADLNKLVKFSVNHKLSGLEFLSGIPATVGGAIVMNAGAFGGNISDHVIEVETICNGKIKKYFKNQCSFGYRTSKFKSNREAVVSATFDLEKLDLSIIEKRIDFVAERRKAIQPNGRSCGSVFINPKPNSAGALIEGAGLKGFRIGGAIVSEKHGNFILTDAGATAMDVKNLILHIKEKVYDVFGVTLREEVEYVGEF